jgi:hypothetical protein
MKEEQETGFMHDLGLGKGQRHAHKTGQSLAQRMAVLQKSVREATGRGEGSSNPSGCYSKETGDE